VSVDFGVHGMSTRLRSVAVRRPPASLATADPDEWHYAAPVDLDRSRHEHRRFVDLLATSGAEVQFIDDEPDELPDSVFTYDPSLVTRGGAVLFNMGKRVRRPEAGLHEAFYDRAGIPILGRVHAPGTTEGGDTLWIDEDTLALGRGYRTNDDGIRQLTAIMSSIDVEVVPFDLPVHQGREACLHLMSLVSPCAPDLALVHLPLMPVRSSRRPTSSPGRQASAATCWRPPRARS
jgi:N-dimethylarginine dimethylaminohydrolase